MKSSVAVKSIPGATTKDVKHHIKKYLEDNAPDSVILHVGTNNLKNKESVEDIANDIMDTAIFVKKEKTNVFVSGLTDRNNRLNDKGKSVNSLLKRRCDEEKICFVDNTNINVGMLNNSGLHLNERGTTRLVNNFCFSLAKWRYFICVDAAVTKKDDFNNPANVTKILKPFSSRKSTDRPSVDQFSKKGYLGSNGKKIRLKAKLCYFPISTSA